MKGVRGHSATRVEPRPRLEAAIGIPFVDGNAIDILKNGDEIFPAMLDAIEQARCTVDFLTFVYWGGDIAERFARTLSAAAKRGVRVRALLDAVGSMHVDRSLVEDMESAGVRVVWFRPPSGWALPGRASSRTHRKILVCDGSVAFTGGVGIGEEWEGSGDRPGSWRETHFRFRGPVVPLLGAAFLENWLEADEKSPPLPDAQLSRSGPTGRISAQVVRSRGGLDWSDRASVAWALIAAASSRIRISTPYLVLDEKQALQLEEAALRGVDVSILVPGPYIDHRVAQVAGATHYERLLEAGVGIFEYQPTMIHQKVAVFDDGLVSIGSANLNERSRLQDHEVQVIVSDRAFAAAIHEMLDDDFSRAEPVAPGAWKRRPLLRRVGEVALRPFRRQL